MKKFKVFFTSFLTAFIVLFSTHAYSNNRKIIYVYSDDGASKTSLEHTLLTLSKLLNSKYNVETITAKKLIEGKWTKNAALFIMPGGADIPYTKKLNGKGNKIIKNFVAKGGSYLGICAGGYYGSGYVEFDKGGDLEVLGERELSFFKGKAIGPILAPYDYKTSKGVRLANIELYITPIDRVGLYFNGGSFFENAENDSNISVLGNYILKNGKKLPAIIHTKYGKGNVILSGVHFEYDPSILSKQDKYLSKVIPKLEKENHNRIKLVNELLSKLHVSITNEL